MQVTLKPDNRKATIIGGISDDLVKVKLEDGRELPWPVSKINMPPKEGEETLKMVKIPAMQRLRQLVNERVVLNNFHTKFTDEEHKKYITFRDELAEEAKEEFKQKWSL